MAIGREPNPPHTRAQRIERKEAPNYPETPSLITTNINIRVAYKTMMGTTARELGSTVGYLITALLTTLLLGLLIGFTSCSNSSTLHVVDQELQRAGGPCSPTDPVDVIIVGAGIAGLAAAVRLNKAGKCVLVLEADEVVGGKCKNWNITQVRDFTQPGAPVVAEDLPVSVGGSFYNPAIEKNFAALIDEAGLSSLQFPPENVDPTQLMPMVFPSALMSRNPDDYIILGEAFMIGRMFPILQEAPIVLRQLQRITVEQWLATFHNATETAKEMVREFVYFQMSIDAKLQDAYSFCQYASQILPFDPDRQIFPNGAVPPLIYQLEGGTGRLVQALHAKLSSLGVNFQTGVMVDHIADSGESFINVIGKKDNGITTYRAKEYVIVTVGPKQMREIVFEPQLDRAISNILEGEAEHETVDYQVFAFFKSQWWLATSKPQSPVIVPPQQLFRTLKSSRKAPRIFGMVVAVPPILSSDPKVQEYGVMRIMVPGDYFKSSEETLREDVIAYLEFFNVTVPPEQLMDVKVFAWNKIASVNHGYIRKNVLINNLHSPYMQVNGGNRTRILFAGTETVNEFRNLMEGAALSGFAAAEKVLGVQQTRRPLGGSAIA